MVAPAPLRRALMPLVTRLSDSVTTIGRALAVAHPGLERLGERLVVTSPPVDLDRFAPDPAAPRRRPRRARRRTPTRCWSGLSATCFPTRATSRCWRPFERLLRGSRGHGTVCSGRRQPRMPTTAAKSRRASRSQRARRACRRCVDPGTRVDALLPAFDVYVMPSRSEGMPTTLIEAMGCALPAVASDVGAVSELLVAWRDGAARAGVRRRSVSPRRWSRCSSTRTGARAWARLRAHARSPPSASSAWWPTGCGPTSLATRPPPLARTLVGRPSTPSTIDVEAEVALGSGPAARAPIRVRGLGRPTAAR